MTDFLILLSVKIFIIIFIQHGITAEPIDRD